mmetsp:Transcript_24050/g.47214  ORF Transcript_24050/g.47214 Transcript_24050/m.47214 type:complete len:105 (+) Transcript_24050:338-652(+)
MHALLCKQSVGLPDLHVGGSQQRLTDRLSACPFVRLPVCMSCLSIRPSNLLMHAGCCLNAPSIDRSIPLIEFTTSTGLPADPSFHLTIHPSIDPWMDDSNERID